jgi:hypothetical protein
MPPNPLRPNEPRKPRALDTILEQWPDEAINARCAARLRTGSRVAGVEFRLEELGAATGSSSGS